MKYEREDSEEIVRLLCRYQHSENCGCVLFLFCLFSVMLVVVIYSTNISFIFHFLPKLSAFSGTNCYYIQFIYVMYVVVGVSLPL